MEDLAKNIKVGDHVAYAVPKPPDATTYAHGVVKSVKTSGSVKIDGTQETFEATSQDPVATIQVWAVDEDGDPVSKTDRVVAKPFSKLRLMRTPLGKDQAVSEDALRKLMEEHNKNAPDGRKVKLSTLKTVFNRGVGAYKTNPSSVRPNVVSADQWGYGRVKAFLKMLKSGRAPRKPFDQDLLPKEHPLSSKASEMIKEGDIVKFMMENDSMFHKDMPPQGTHEHVGSVEHVMYDGYFGVPGSKFYSPASVENPAVLIRIWIDDEETEFMTGRMSDEVAKVGELEDQEDDLEDDLDHDSYYDMDDDEKDEAATYPIPDRVKKNAQRGLELRKKFGRGGTDVGENTARTLAAGGSIGIEKVRHINRYFPRHAGDNLSDKTSNGWIAWLLWGGDAAWSWTRRIVRSYEARDGAKMFTQERRMKLAKEGIAMPDGSYPIVSINDLKNAIQAFGRAKDPEATKKHIMKRARSLNAEDLIPENWMK
jgi:hypothetical protein